MSRFFILMLLCGGAAQAGAQQFQFHLDHLAAKASETVDLALTGPTLQLAATFIDGKDPDEAKVKKLISGLQGIWVKSYEFKEKGVWQPADLDRVRNQLRAPEWARIVGVKSTGESETAEVFLRTTEHKITGMAILASEPTTLTVINIAGPIDPEALSDLGGHFGVPKLKLPSPAHPR
jgi:Domain of unknown function (DUF4252)